ncbi:CbtA family protein [Jongsikchunia kroppenstedtii]|uniref:CbtA family protein n=1 Tax=Jongsikchunia kroppenstedtii TaxID=1121721 RepID=UPI000380DF97|nr:CbtA family protein [Jongsikchunia kroppenstedtii]
MELRVIGRGVLAGFIAGVLGFVFARIFAEPQIDKAIDYESGRDDWLHMLNKAAGFPVEPDGPEIFSRHIQSTIGIATGIIGFSMAMGALCAVAYVVLHGRFAIKAQTLAWMIAGFGFLGVFMLPFVKYPANPPAIGHEFTIVQRSHLYLTMVGISLVLLGLTVYAAYKLTRRFGRYPAILMSAVGFFVIFGIIVGVMPTLGGLSENSEHVKDFGFAHSTTETPQPITNVLDHPLNVALEDGSTQTIQPGQIVYPGFDPDVLWKFRWYSILNQLLVWTVIAMIFGALLDRLVAGKPVLPRRKKTELVSA